MVTALRPLKRVPEGKFNQALDLVDSYQMLGHNTATHFACMPGNTCETGRHADVHKMRALGESGALSVLMDNMQSLAFLPP